MLFKMETAKGFEQVCQDLEKAVVGSQIIFIQKGGDFSHWVEQKGLSCRLNYG